MLVYDGCMCMCVSQKTGKMNRQGQNSQSKKEVRTMEHTYIHIYILIYMEMETILPGVGRHHGDRRVSGKKEASTETGVCHHKTTHFVRQINK